MKPRHLSLLLLILAIASCTKKTEDLSEKKIFHQKDAEDTGITFNNILTENDSLNYFTYAYLYMGGGVSAGDINNDGLIDLFFTGNMVPNKLYLNKGNLKFEDISEKAGVSGDARWYTGVTMTDINNDGFLDLYCSVGGKFGTKENQLFINNGDNTFSEKAEAYGLADSGNSVQASFFDYDQDGDLDLYLGNYPPTPFNAPNHYYAFKQQHPMENEMDKLYRNDGDKFTDVTAEAGLSNFGLTLSATVGDLNADGWPDIYVSNDFSSPDYLYINNKNGTFSEQVKNLTKNTSFYGMGVDIADFNNDQLLDILQVDMTAKDNRRAKANMASMNPDLFWSTVNAGFHYQYMQNSLQMNNGNLVDSLPDFSNVSRLSGVSSTDWSWGPLFADLDNDGWKDIFISNGTRREINNRDYFLALDNQRKPSDNLLERSLAIPSEKIDNFVFRNNKDLTFTQMNDDWGISFKGFSNGCVYVDLDNDGDLEIVTNNIDDKASIFENTSSSNNNYITLNFKGPEKNPFGIGVKTYIKTNDSEQFQELTMTRGFQSSVAPQLHFGLGQEKTVNTLRIKWPDGKEEILNNIPSNQFLGIDYKNAAIISKEVLDIKEKLFTTIKDTILLAPHKHIENYYNDFEKEILLPHQTSMFGPSLAVGDLNGDGLEDYIIGGASQNQTAVFFQSKSGFMEQDIPALANDSGYEDMGIHIFDADNDGDNDIYIVSGGNEFEYNSTMLQDRLYVNSGNGKFERSIQALPEMITSGSRIHSFDYDKDGDLDLFVGGRLIPGNYPLPANSYLLENISSLGTPKFVDVTQKIAPELAKLGMVTDAIWTDYDNDGWEDLIVVGEWMPISVFQNQKGLFKNITKKLKLEDSNGWWFSINEGDFDNDGDMDYIIGNLGLNYKYKANETETFDIYFNDFDNNKTNDIVLSYFNGGKKYPLRGRECSSQQIPTIKQKFKDYSSFSVATLEDVYTEEYLENSLHYKVKSFTSILLENKNGSFVKHNLPNLAQISSINQILVDDFDGDSNLDIIVAGNLYSSEVETPRNDAGKGLYLKGDGNGHFQPIKNYDSGLFIPGDVKDMVPIMIKGEKYFLIGKNSDYQQLVKINS
ncbi:VCBS repeat-containing protein [Flavobacteriaceae bacterium KMM 6898]|nr:VCBS repeat-containing protein [Flavobacteriaceae bacterium KMM 6898]